MYFFSSERKLTTYKPEGYDMASDVETFKQAVSAAIAGVPFNSAASLSVGWLGLVAAVASAALVWW